MELNSLINILKDAIDVIDISFFNEEGIHIDQYFYIIKNDPDCTYGYPILKSYNSSKLINDYLILKRMYNSYSVTHYNHYI